MVDTIPITPPRVALIDSRSGLVSREWYLFFLKLFNQTNTDISEIDDLQKGPASGSDLAPINTALQALGVSERNPFDPSNIDAAIQALAVQPFYTPQLPRLRYGSFYDTTDQTAAVINTAYAMTFNATDFSSGVYIGSPTSRIYVDTLNVYNIQFSAQLLNTGGGAHDVWIWLRKNGTDVPNTATSLRIEGNNTKQVAAWNFLLQLNANDYFELMWEVSDLAVTIDYEAATAIHPAIPSVILTVTDNISS